MERVGVQELCQHASHYLARVVNGETLEVTDRGRPVARLVPIGHVSWNALVESGRVAPAQDLTDITDEPPAEYGIRASSLLAAMRAEEPGGSTTIPPP